MRAIRWATASRGANEERPRKLCQLPHWQSPLVSTQVTSMDLLAGESPRIYDPPCQFWLRGVSVFQRQKHVLASCVETNGQSQWHTDDRGDHWFQSVRMITDEGTVANFRDRHNRTVGQANRGTRRSSSFGLSS